MAWTMERSKTVIEIVAIFGAAVFAVITWGIDAWKTSAPNWAISFGHVNQATSTVVNGNDQVCLYKGCKIATSCLIESAIKTENKAKSPLYVEITKLYFYSYKKPKASKFVDHSLYRAYESLQRCNSETQTTDCPLLIEKVEIGKIDLQPLYPSQEAWRPFSVTINTEELPNGSPLNNYSKNNGILIVAYQELMTKGFFGNTTEHTAKSAYDIDNLCGRGFYADDTEKTASCLTDQCS